MDLTSTQKLWLLTADPNTGMLSGAPEWLIGECHDLGLVTPGTRSGTWILTPAGRRVWQSLSEDE